MQHPIDTAARIVGTQMSLARALGVTRAAVGQWKIKGRFVPMEHGPDIERLTKGQVSCEALCPQNVWVRIPDPEWPHPAGRPAVDLAKQRAGEVEQDPAHG